MNSNLSFSLSDPTLLTGIWLYLFGTRYTCPVSSLLDFDRFRSALKEHGVTMEIRAASTTSVISEKCINIPTLFIGGDLGIFVKNRHTTWQCFTKNGFKKVQPMLVAKMLDINFDRDFNDRISDAWAGLDLSRIIISRIYQKYGLDGTLKIADVIRAAVKFSQSPNYLARLALDHPGEFPTDLTNCRVNECEFVEIRFVKQLLLVSGRSPVLTILDLMRREVRFIGLLFFAGLVAIPFGFGLSVLTATIIDNARVSTGFPWSVFGLTLMLILSSLIIGAIQGYSSIRLTSRLRVRLTNSYVFRVLNANISSVRQLADGDILTRLSDLFSIQSLVFGTLLPLVTTSFMLVGSMLYFLAIADYLLPVIAFGVILGAINVAIRLPELKKIRLRQLEHSSLLRDRLLERVEGWRVFRHLDTAGKLFSRVDESFAKVATYSQRQTVISSQMGFVSSIIGMLVLSLSIWLIAERFQSGQATLGTILVVLGILTAAYAQMTSLVNIIPKIVLAEPSLNRLNELIACTDPELVPQFEEEEVKGPLALIAKDLTYKWRDDSFALRGVSLEIRAGDWAAVIGPSGSGKSTLASIFGGLIEPASGSMVLDNMDCSQVSREYVRRRIAVVTQDIFLLDRSIRENIVLGDIRVTDSELERVIVESGLGLCINGQPLGLDQPVGDNGKFLSVGEKCRIGIARALLRQPGLLVLDEALARMDINSAMGICKQLKNLNCSILMMTHDLLQVQICDNIYVINKGLNVESGSYSSLIGSGGLFTEMLKSKTEELP